MSIRHHMNEAAVFPEVRSPCPCQLLLLNHGNNFLLFNLFSKSPQPLILLHHPPYHGETAKITACEVNFLKIQKKQAIECTFVLSMSFYLGKITCKFTYCYRSFSFTIFYEVQPSFFVFRWIRKWSIPVCPAIVV